MRTYIYIFSYLPKCYIRICYYYFFLPNSNPKIGKNIIYASGKIQ